MVQHLCQASLSNRRQKQDLAENDVNEEYLDDQSLSSFQGSKQDESLYGCEEHLPGYKCIMEHMVAHYGHEKSGWFVLVNYDSKSAVIANFEEESHYSSQTGNVP